MVVECWKCKNKIPHDSKICPHCKTNRAAWNNVAITVVALTAIFILYLFLNREKTQPDPAHAQAVAEGRLIYTAKDHIAQMMKDPGSTEFRNVFVSRDAEGAVVCGEVNSKNSFGGYSGFQRFISVDPMNIVETGMKKGEMDSLWQKFCGRQ